MKFYQSSIFCVTLALLALSDETRSRDYFRDQNGLEPVSRPFWDQNVTLPRVTRLVSRPFSRPKWSRLRSRDQYRHQNVTLCSTSELSTRQMGNDITNLIHWKLLKSDFYSSTSICSSTWSDPRALNLLWLTPPPLHLLFTPLLQDRLPRWLPSWTNTSIPKLAWHNLNQNQNHANR